MNQTDTLKLELMSERSNQHLLEGALNMRPRLFPHDSGRLDVLKLYFENPSI